MKDNFTILHISDFHYSGAYDHEHKVVYDAFFRDLEKAKSNGIGDPDLVLFTGDLVNDPDEDDCYGKYIEQVVVPIMRVTAVSPDKIIFVPGNHDASRNYLGSAWLEQDRIEERASSRDLSNLFYKERKSCSFVDKKFENYNIFNDCFDNKSEVYSDSFVTSYYVKDINISVIAVNTAWLTRAGLKEINDYGRLVVPELALRTALERVPEQSTIVVAGHHPLDWLQEFSKKDMQAFISKHARFYFCGHMHDPFPQCLTTPIGAGYVSQSGSMYAGRKYYNGYSYVSSNASGEHIRFLLRSYYDQREEFDVATNVIESGIFFSSKSAKHYWDTIPSPVDASDLGDWLRSQVLSEVRPLFDDGLSARPVSEVFVPPPLIEREFNSDAETGEAKARETEDEGKEVPFEDLLTTDDNFIIYGRHEDGKTTLLQQIALQTITRQAECQHCYVPIYLHFSDLKDGKDRILKLLRSRMAEWPAGNFKFNDILAQGHILVLIDDVDFGNAKKMGQICEFARQFPRNRYVFSAAKGLYESIGAVASLDAGVPFRSVFIQPFTRRSLRVLVEKWDPDNHMDRDAVLDRLTSDFMYMNLPRTGVTSAILLSIFEQERDFIPINKSVLTERFLELLLDKYSFNEALRGRFDFRNKVHLLGFVAKHMVEEDRYRYKMHELTAIVAEYLISLGLKQDSQAIVNDLIQAKILAWDGDDIRFKYRSFLEFFVASRMNEDQEFKGYILQEENYLSFSNEIELYAGLVRNDNGLLELVGTRFAAYEKQFSEEAHWDRDLESLDGLNVSHAESKVEFFEEIEREIKAPRLSDEQRDELIEAELPRDVGDRQEVYRPAFDDVGQKWTWALILYSKVLKNSELIDDNIKREHLALVIAGWGRFLINTLLIIPSLVRHRRMTISGIAYHVVAPKSMSDDEVGRALYLSMPRAMTDLIRMCLGTEKLESQLIGDESKVEPRISSFFRRVLYAELKLPNFARVLYDLLDRLRGSDYLLEAFLWKVRHLRQRQHLTDKQDERVRKLLAEGGATLYPGSRMVKARKKSSEMQRLERERILQRLRLDRGKEGD